MGTAGVAAKSGLQAKRPEKLTSPLFERSRPTYIQLGSEPGTTDILEGLYRGQCREGECVFHYSYLHSWLF